MTSITETVRSTAQGMAKAESADKKSTETVDTVSQERVGSSQNPEPAPSEVHLSEEVAKAIEAAEFDAAIISSNSYSRSSKPFNKLEAASLPSSSTPANIFNASVYRI